jgi:RNA polymerase sigma-70 factor (ECF subfamily)
MAAEGALNRLRAVASETAAGEREKSSEPDDAELVRRSRDGDTQAFDALVTRYREKVFAMTYGMLRNEEDAWDLTQEGFIRAWKALPRFRGESAFFTWLYRIVMNLTIDRARSRKGEASQEFDETIHLKDVAPGSEFGNTRIDAPDDRASAKDIKVRIDAAIVKLTPEHREVILLREMEGLEYHEIAERIGQPIGTVMSRLFYARKRLQGMLRDLYEQL